MIRTLVCNTNLAFQRSHDHLEGLGHHWNLGIHLDLFGQEDQVSQPDPVNLREIRNEIDGIDRSDNEHEPSLPGAPDGPESGFRKICFSYTLILYGDPYLEGQGLLEDPVNQHHLSIHRWKQIYVGERNMVEQSLPVQ